MNTRIFCKDCMYFDENGIMYFLDGGICKSPQNEAIAITYYSEKVIYKKTPQEINKNNKCKYYLRRGTRILSITGATDHSGSDE